MADPAPMYPRRAIVALWASNATSRTAMACRNVDTGVAMTQDEVRRTLQGESFDRLEPEARDSLVAALSFVTGTLEAMVLTAGLGSPPPSLPCRKCPDVAPERLILKPEESRMTQEPVGEHQRKSWLARFFG